MTEFMCDRCWTVTPEAARSTCVHEETCALCEQNWPCKVCRAERREEGL